MHNEYTPNLAEIEETFDRLIDLFWIDVDCMSEFLRGAMCAMTKIIDFKRAQEIDREDFKRELVDAVMDDVDHKAKIRTERGGQTSFLS